ncbi:Fic family protein [Youngiibacter fragilis]|uniref:Fic family protein n=1 Tax=Youngiibacter fragilis 232.1 TaxID=994573 RepID=V7I1U4_9CLOT|nr:Fic family protein [Youngiibacter fragilis]ETA78992.1 Fic family protein [Youngiibacter fragilis 232.1]
MSKNGYVPPYTISNRTVNLISEITEIIVEIAISDKMSNNPRLRRDSRIRTIHASLAIENNSLSLDQMTDIINGKRVLGSPDEICEVKNAFEAYERLLELNPYSIEDLLLAHKVLMKDLTKEAGTYRSGGVGVFAGEQLVHMAPPATQVPHLIKDLVEWANESEVHPLIKSCVFHYEFEFIHPFADGNGRMGRMWQTLILYKWKPLFGWLPIETLIKERQDEYYKVLGECDHSADSGKFIDFVLTAIYDALRELAENAQVTAQVTEQVTEQVEKLLGVMSDKEYSTKDLMELLGLKHRQSFRDKYLLPALEMGYVAMTIPDKPSSSRQMYKKLVKK